MTFPHGCGTLYLFALLMTEYPCPFSSPMSGEYRSRTDDLPAMLRDPLVTERCGEYRSRTDDLPARLRDALPLCIINDRISLPFFLADEWRISESNRRPSCNAAGPPSRRTLWRISESNRRPSRTVAGRSTSLHY